MDAATRQRICQLVAGLIISDDILDPKEEAFLDRMIKSFGIDDPAREIVLPLIDHTEAAAEIKMLDPAAQNAALTLLIEAAYLDGTVVDEEREYLRVVGRAIGLSDGELEQRIVGAALRG